MTADALFRWIGALLVGAIVSALMAAAYLGAEVFPWAILVTLAHVFIFGLPLALVYRAQKWTRLSASVLGGLAIGLIPGSVYAQFVASLPGAWSPVETGPLRFIEILNV